MKTFDTENLKIQYASNQILDYGEYPRRSYKVNVIEKMTFKKPVVRLDGNRLVIDRALIQDAKRDFWEEVKKELIPHAIPLGNPAYCNTPIVSVVFDKLPEYYNPSDLSEAKNIILYLMEIIGGKLVPDDTDIVYEMFPFSEFYADDKAEINGNIVSLVAIAHLDKIVSEYEIEYAKTHRPGF